MSWVLIDGVNGFCFLLYSEELSIFSSYIQVPIPASTYKMVGHVGNSDW